MPSLALKPAKPLIRWAGSKRKLLPQLLEAVPSEFKCYYEPFFGSGCLFFALNPKKAVLGDINIDLINFYQITAKHSLSVLRSARNIPRTKLNYYKIRTRLGEEDTKERRAAYFLFLNRFCFNGIYRTNAKGLFNVPFGTETGSFPKENEFVKSVSLLKRAKFICDDFEVTLKSASEGDFVYIDPPYVYQTRRDRGEYGPECFSLIDIDRLHESLIQLNNRGVKFLLSYLSCPEAKELAKDFHCSTISVKRCVSGLLASRKSVDELLIRNY